MDRQTNANYIFKLQTAMASNSVNKVILWALKTAIITTARSLASESCSVRFFS